MLGYSCNFAPPLYHLRRCALPWLSHRVWHEGTALPVRTALPALVDTLPPWDGDLETALEREFCNRRTALRREGCRL